MTRLQHNKIFKRGIDNDNVNADRSSHGEESYTNYPHGVRLALIMTSAYLSMFLVALVRMSFSLHITTIATRLLCLFSFGHITDCPLTTG